MTKSEVARLFERIVYYYPAFTGDIEKINAWHEVLGRTLIDQAMTNLKQHVSDPDNKYPPHPGALAKSLDSKTDVDRYHDHMKMSGIVTLKEWETMRANAVGPTEEQRRKVREKIGRSV